MSCILLFTNNLHHAITLVSFIALPMIIINSLGTAIFLTIILSTIKQEEQMRAVKRMMYYNSLMKHYLTFDLDLMKNQPNKLLKLF